MAGQPKAAFYVVLALVVAGLVGFGIWRSDLLAPKGKDPAQNKIDPGQLTQAEANSDKRVTTVEVYTIKPSERLPEVKGVSSYAPLKDDTVRFALNVWSGWGPIILANDGFKAKKVWKTPDGKPFKVELVLIDDPIAMRDSYASGQVHIGWATLDMVPLLMEGFVKANDSRVMPRIYQQIDWSNGGDGIVVRKDIQTVRDLRDKKIVMAQNSPSQYFALNMLVSGGLQPSEVKMIYTNTAFEAAAAFQAQKDIAGAVSWSPDIYKLADQKKINRMLVTTATANKLIADVWFARADFAKDHPDILEGLVRGIFDGMEDLKDPEKKKHCAQLMAQGYSIPADDAMNMFADAHNTNWAENYQFFMNRNNPTNFEHVWRQSYYLYKQIGSITHQPVPFDQVMDFTIIDKLSKDPKYSSSKDDYEVKLVPKPISAIKVEGDEILTNTVVIHFFPNSWDLRKTVTKDVDGKTIEELYDPKVDLVLDKIAQLAAQFGAARVIIEGHTDSSMRGQVPAQMVKELSYNRANAVKEALVNKFKLDPNRIAADGLGWDRPADPDDPQNHAQNRRVEVKIYSAEKQ